MSVAMIAVGRTSVGPSAAGPGEPCGSGSHGLARRAARSALLALALLACALTAGEASAQGLEQGAPRQTQTISGVVQKIGQGFALLGSDGQRYELDAEDAGDMAGLVGRRVTVTGEVVRSDMPASGAAGAIGSRNVIKVTSIDEQ